MSVSWLTPLCQPPGRCGKRSRSRCCPPPPSSITFSTCVTWVESGRACLTLLLTLSTTPAEWCLCGNTSVIVRSSTDSSISRIKNGSRRLSNRYDSEWTLNKWEKDKIRYFIKFAYLSVDISWRKAYKEDPKLSYRGFIPFKIC